MPEDVSININNELRPFEDYDFLRAEGIRLIEKLAGKVWTDYNTHDPGITLLEALCYTLTDLGYRTSFDIKDILATADAKAGWAGIFYTAKQILPSNPVTLTDYRKLIIDTDGVKNAWVQVSNDYEVLLYLNTKQAATTTDPPSYEVAYSSTSDNEPLRMKGLYKVTVEYEDDIIEANKQPLVDATVRQKLNGHRNLCEDFLDLRPVNYEFFKMDAEVQVKEGSDIERINAKIFQVIHNFFSPSVKFYTLDQMLAKGYSPEDIFEGPSLKNGFIDTTELETSERYTDIHLSDIINLISDIPGVIAVKKCIFPIETQSAFSDFTQWITSIREKEKAPRLDIDNSNISFSRSGDRHRSNAEKVPDKQRVKDIYSFLQSETRTSKLKGAANDIPVPAGEFMNIAEYYPFQYSLPSSYGMQEKIGGGDIDINDLRQMADQDLLQIRDKQILQLRGFLMVFEQIMADYLSQLANMRRLFNHDDSISQTYFPQPVEGINDMQLLFLNAKKYLEGISALIESDKLFLTRRNSILNHLMARVGENAEAYAVPAHTYNKNNLTAAIHNKSSILSDYIAISSYRGNGFDYANQDEVWDTSNVTGMKRRICRLLGMANFNTRFITSDWITIEKVDRPGTENWTKVVIRDPANPKNVLIESNEYRDESEIREILKYMLTSGFDKTLYNIDARHDKYSFQLKRQSQEKDFEVVGGLNFTTREDLDSTFKKNIETLSAFAHSENFHVLEHLLLRPKMNPQETGAPSDAGDTKFKVTDLLSVINVPDNDFFVNQKARGASYTFKITTIKDPVVSYKTVWRLKLQKDKTDILVAEDDFVFENHIRKRMEHIRQIATDETNFVTETDGDGRGSFRIMDKSKKPAQELAVSARGYPKDEDMRQEISSLIKFFSYEIGFLDEEDSDTIDLNSYADPYSFRVSLFVPAWPVKFRDPRFRHLFEKAVYLESPAHIYTDVYWLDYKEMKDFEAVYKLWLKEISLNLIPDTAIVNNLIDVVNEIRSFNEHVE
jgi:hypothetical protein